MLREALGCFIGRWTEVLDAVVSKRLYKLAPSHSAFLVASRERERSPGYTYRKDQRDTTPHSF